MDVDDYARSVFAENGLEPPDTLMVAKGCNFCNEQGVYGRTGVFEVHVLNQSTRDAILNLNSPVELTNCLANSGMKTLTQEALAKAADGVISLDEALGIRCLV